MLILIISLDPTIKKNNIKIIKRIHDARKKIHIVMPIIETIENEQLQNNIYSELEFVRSKLEANGLQDGVFGVGPDFKTAFERLYSNGKPESRRLLHLELLGDSYELMLQGCFANTVLSTPIRVFDYPDVLKFFAQYEKEFFASVKIVEKDDLLPESKVQRSADEKHTKCLAHSKNIPESDLVLKFFFIKDQSRANLPMFTASKDRPKKLNVAPKESYRIYPPSVSEQFGDGVVIEVSTDAYDSTSLRYKNYRHVVLFYADNLNALLKELVIPQDLEQFPVLVLISNDNGDSASLQVEAGALGYSTLLITLNQSKETLLAEIIKLEWIQALLGGYDGYDYELVDGCVPIGLAVSLTSVLNPSSSQVNLVPVPQNFSSPAPVTATPHCRYPIFGI